MLDIDYLFSEDKDVIIAVLVAQIRDQACDLENLQERVESLSYELKVQKESLDLPVVKSVKVVRGKLPKTTKKAVEPVEPVKRGRGRPKKTVE